MRIVLATLIILFCTGNLLTAQDPLDVELTIDPSTQYQTMEGFGAALAYYENWLIAHPNKNEIYEAVFGELSLDILRVRNAHEYDPNMIDRVVEFANAAENVRGSRIPILSSSWGPPARLKSNNDRKNGGSLRYSLEGEQVKFDYSGFAEWWEASLDEYEENGIYLEYLSLQNEPDFTASWESCRFDPNEKIDASDTIAGYDQALDAVYDSIQDRAHIPKILGPETVGIGYNSVQRYSFALDESKLYGIAHHLYHGVDEENPYASGDFTNTRIVYPNIPHFQTEFSRGDWFSLAGLIYKSLHDEWVVSYMYWDLIWDGGGLVSLDFPWNSGGWSNSKGYTKTKDFYSFKQYSALIHPGWIRVESPVSHSSAKAVAFVSPQMDSAALVVVNASSSNTLSLHIEMEGYKLMNTEVFVTSESQDFESMGSLQDSVLVLEPESIASLSFEPIIYTGILQEEILNPGSTFYPNPASETGRLAFTLGTSASVDIVLMDMQGRILRRIDAGNLSAGKHTEQVDLSTMEPGVYNYQILGDKESIGRGMFIVK